MGKSTNTVILHARGSVPPQALRQLSWIGQGCHFGNWITFHRSKRYLSVLGPSPAPSHSLSLSLPLPPAPSFGIRKKVWGSQDVIGSGFAVCTCSSVGSALDPPTLLEISCGVCCCLPAPANHHRLDGAWCVYKLNACIRRFTLMLVAELLQQFKKPRHSLAEGWRNSFGRSLFAGSGHSELLIFGMCAS